MTNTVSVLHLAKLETWMQAHSDTIIEGTVIGVVVAGICGAWAFVIKPVMHAIERKTATKRRQKEIVKSLASIGSGGGNDVRFGWFVFVRIHNKTSRPFTIRTVAFKTEKGGLLELSVLQQLTLGEGLGSRTGTGWQIASNSHLDWIWLCKYANGTKFPIAGLDITFEYDNGDENTLVTEFKLPDSIYNRIKEDYERVYNMS